MLHLPPKKKFILVSFWWTLLFTHWLNFTSALQSTQIDTFSVSGCHLVAHDTKKTKKKIKKGKKKEFTLTREPTNTHLSHTIIYPSGLQNHVNRPKKIRNPTPVYHVYHRLRLSPNRMSCWTAAAQCSMDRSYSAGGATAALCFTPKWLASWPQRLHTLHSELLWYPWEFLYSTLSMFVFSFWIALLIIVIATAVCTSVCFLGSECFVTCLGCFCWEMGVFVQKCCWDFVLFSPHRICRNDSLVTLCPAFTV